jgi:5'-nucleotidase
MEESYFIHRRNFIRMGGLGALGIWSTPWISQSKKEFTLSILHTNDWHSRIDPFPNSDPKFPGQGGASKRAYLIKNIRATADEVLLLDAGDIIQGTPYFNYYGGEPEIKLMNAMKYDAATLGNHDFDNGLEALAKLIKLADFPFVNCNYNLEGTPLQHLIKKSIVLKKRGTRIGITGVGINLRGYVPDSHHAGIQYLDPIENANMEALRLKTEEKCTVIICLSHLGYSYTDQKVSDIRLAEQSENIDIIIGGHTHTFLERPEKVRNRKGKNVVINQVGWAGLRLGQIECVFSSQNNTKNKAEARIKLFKKSIAI